MVLRGPPGVGKTELACEFARRWHDSYPGGTFMLDMSGTSTAIDLAGIGRTCLGIEFGPEVSIDDQALSTFHALGGSPSLLILDSAPSQDAVQPWLPLARMPCHAVITAVFDDWDPSWSVVPIEPLSDPVAIDLVAKLAGPELAARHGRRLVEFAGGLPVQLVPRCLTLAKDVRRRGDAVIEALTDDTRDSFRGVYDNLAPEPRLLLHAAGQLNTNRIIVEELKRHLAEGAGWNADEFARHLGACQDVQVLRGDAELKMHQLFARFIRETRPAAEIAGLFDQIIKAQDRRMMEIAREIIAAPKRIDLASILLTYPLVPATWAMKPEHIFMATIGRALSLTGQFVAARPWYERAVAEAEKGDVDGRVDHERLSTSLHQMGNCLSSTGEFAAGRPWFERAVAEAEKGNVDGRVDHESLGTSLHQVAYCLSSTGAFAAARPWFERAVAEKEQGDVHGRVDHASLGTSLHQVAYCLSSTEEFAAARPWYERAVTEKEQGDVHGRVDHASLGTSLDLVGYCLANTGEFAAARPWHERAVAEKEQGDVYGRVDHVSLGTSLDFVGNCLINTGEFAAARPWYERAAVEKEHGDVYGRVDHESLSASLHQVGICLSNTGEFAAARPWYERAVAEKEKGGVDGRVDHESLKISRQMLESCLK